MRRFDKLKVIKESNEMLEKRFLTETFNTILEQEFEDLPKEEPVSPVTPKKQPVDFKKSYDKIKELYRLKGDDKQSTGLLPNSTNFNLTIKIDGTYNIVKRETKEEVQKGTFNLDGVLNNKPTFKPEKGEKFLSLEEILKNLNSTPKDDKSSSFLEQFKTYVRNPNKVTIRSEIVQYPFFKEDQFYYLIYLRPDKTNESVGKFQLVITDGYESFYYPKNNPLEGTFSDYGSFLKISTSKLSSPIEVGLTTGRKGSYIDDSLVKMLKEIQSQFKI